MSLSEIIRNFDAAGEFIPPAEWSQGRTLYGGLSAALALQTALSAATGPLPPLKSALISFIGPAAGPLRFEARTLREGRSATSISADCLAGPNVCVRAEFLFAAPRVSRVQHEYYRRPAVDPPESLAPLRPEGKAPVFLANFDLRPATSTLPMSGASYPELVAWVRHVDASGVDPVVAMIALADALPPAALATLTDMVTLSSMTWTVDFSQPVRSGAWHLLRSTSQRARDGYSFQTMEIWDRDGGLVLSGCQTVAVFD